MGEVYRARDARLGRDVAIKVVASALANHPDRVQRFEQEARAVAALNHPNILAVHDVGTHDSLPYIVSELLEGETLADRLGGGKPVPVRKAVEYAIQIARGLAAAHEKGIVHRDLKPANVFVTTDGQVKLLDFGLAKLVEPEFEGVVASVLPTVLPATTPGIVLGTVGYMAPEQARGKPAGHRADIFAFGAILYEMLSGRRAFQRDDAADTLMAILKEDPPDLPVDERHIPPALARIVDRCLEKNPSARFQSATDLAFALDALSATTASGEGLHVAATPLKSQLRRWLWMAASFAIGVALATIAMSYLRAPESTRQTRFAVTTPELLAGGLAISPDGQHVAFSARTSPTTYAIYVRSMDAVEPKLLSGTDNGSGPFWSTDSQHLGFFADGKLKRIAIAGGPPQTIAAVPGVFAGATWNTDGVIVFGQDRGPLKRVSASGGEPIDLTDLRDREVTHEFPVFLPDQRHFLFGTVSMGAPQDPPTIVVGSLDSKERTPVGLKAFPNLNYASPGYLVFHRDRTLFVQPFDPKRLSLSGEPRRVTDDLAMETLVGVVGSFSVSTTGALVYHTAPAQNQLVWYDRAGRRLGSVGATGDYHGIALSPDNTRVAIHLHEQAAGGDIWVLDVDRGTFTRFTSERGHHLVPMWSPDGRVIAFASDRDGDGSYGIYQKSSSGVGNEAVVFKPQGSAYPEDFAPDGQSMSIGRNPNNGTVASVEVLPLTGERKPQPFTNNTEWTQAISKFSPDGHWIAYFSNESRRAEIYVEQYPGRTKKVQISTGGGEYPRWSRNGKELFYMTGDGTIMAVDVREDATTFHASAPRVLFKTAAALTDHYGAHYEYDVTSDGQRFLVNERLTAVNQTGPLTVVLNWTASLKK